MQKESNIKLHTVLKKIINYEGWVQDRVGVFETEPPNQLTRQAFVLKKTARQTWSASFPIQNLEQKQNNGHKTRKKKRKKKKRKMRFLNARTTFLFPVITKLLPILIPSYIYTFESSQTIHKSNTSKHNQVQTPLFSFHYSSLSNNPYKLRLKP